MTEETRQARHIFVWRRRIVRKGRTVEGFQAGFTPEGGATDTDREALVNYYREIARMQDIEVLGVVDL